MPTISRPTVNITTPGVSENARSADLSVHGESLNVASTSSPDRIVRGRSLSSASTSSSLSISSPTPSSNNASTSSVNLVPNGTIAYRGEGLSAAMNINDEDIHFYRDSIAQDGGPEAPQEFVLAMHDFVPQPANPTCLSFRAGQIIHVLNRDPSGWWDGELKGRRGWFPSNYVQKETLLLEDEEMPHSNTITQGGHVHAKSEASVASWESAVPLRSNDLFLQDAFGALESELLYAEGSNNCPPLMVPLYRGIHVLQNAIRGRNTGHYQPAAAMIVSTIRSILTTTECLEREAPILRKNMKLALERKLVLSELAALVGEVKKCSNELADEDEREIGEERMLRLAGQLFARVRRFLAVAVQCGVDISEEWPEHDIGTVFQSNPIYDNGYTNRNYDTGDLSNGGPSNYLAARMEDYSHHNNRQYGRARDRTVTPDSMTRTRLQPDNLSQRHKLLEDSHSDDSYTPMISQRTSETFQLKQEKYFGSKLKYVDTRSPHRAGHKSISSTSSFSSSSSFDSMAASTYPPFPSGPCTPSQVLVALKYTHDNLLSTVAAFIGGVHSYSRFAHASSTGHLYDLVRQIVELVCKALTIVEATLKHPGIPGVKRDDLRLAKERLYETTNELPPVIRKLTSNEPSSRSEEDEKQDTLRLATDTVKAGSDCSYLVRYCLNESQGDERFFVILPSSDDDTITTNHRRVYSRTVAKIPSMDDLQETYEANSGVPLNVEEDVTVRAQSQIPPSLTVKSKDPSSDDSNSVISISVSITESDEETAPTSSGSGLSVDPKPRSDSLRVNVALASSNAVEADLPSPISLVRTEGDNTTWDGHQKLNSLEEKLVHGDLPSVPHLPEITALSKCLSHDYAPEDVAYNSEGHLVGATWEALVEKMTPHDSIVDPAFAAIFLLTFRLFSSTVKLANTLIERYNLNPPFELNEEELAVWKQRKMMPVRLRVSNFIKLWLETYWRPETDDLALPILLDFVRTTMSETFRDAARRIEVLINARKSAGKAISIPVVDRSQAGDRMRDAASITSPVISPSEIPRPVMTKALLAALRSKSFASIAISDFDALELARQLTILECSLYCAVTREEVLEMGQSGASPAQNVKAVSSLSTAITGWVAESILNEPDTKKRTVLVKFFIKIAERCATLNNFSTSRSVLAALDSSTIARLNQTWMGLQQKNRLQLESLRKLADHAKNYSEYRSRLRNTVPPAVPFLGLYLTDITFCREGNLSHRASPMAPAKQLVNFNKYHKLARIVQDMQRFQLPYNLKEIPEVQEYLQYCFEKSKHNGDLDDLYRRSLKVEPKQPADASTPNSELKQLFSWTIRGQASQPT